MASPARLNTHGHSGQPRQYEWPSSGARNGSAIYTRTAEILLVRGINFELVLIPVAIGIIAGIFGPLCACLGRVTFKSVKSYWWRKADAGSTWAARAAGM
jgi:hypothetical protein